MVLQGCRLQPELKSLAGKPASSAALALESCPPLVSYSLYIANPSPKIRAMLAEFASQWRWVKPLVDGRVLKEMGISNGPRIGEILAELKAAWIDGRISTPDEEHDLLERIIAEGHPESK
jgi:tRNA nucleotidyltransferase (CCA-adding enzyme)